MKPEEAELFAKRIAQRIETQITDYFQMNVIEKLELLNKRFKPDSDNPFKKMLPEIIEEWHKENENPDSPFHFGYVDARLTENLEVYSKLFFQNFIEFGVLLCLFGSSQSPLFSEYRNEVLKKHNLTEKKLIGALLGVFGSFLKDAKHGGKKGFWNNKKKLELLATYNRFLIVIKNARRDKRLLKKKKVNTEMKIEQELLEKYEVPKVLMKSLFSDNSPGEVALDWAIKEMKLKNFSFDYLDGTILKEARKVCQLQKINGILIDVSFAYGEYKYYGINANNKELKKTLENDLRFTRVCKTPRIDRSIPPKFEKYLIKWSLNRE